MKKPLYFTFGNHMHWVDMQWLWGYDVLPSSIRDMLRLVREAGVPGNVNFDGVGYERLAAEAPEALAELRAAVQRGDVEVVGASYGQPYGLFQGAESNVRQRVLGARVVRRLLGVWPSSFWEEEFDFFPQLPQVLAGCGFETAALFFQWTWHTPSMPEERLSLIRWEGLDGTRLAALPRNELCLHQWPEDFAGRLDGGLVSELERPAVVQWLELLPSPDWMCRSELLLPALRELLADPRFEVRPRTLGGLVRELSAAQDAPVRRYGLDDVFHGMSLGKNTDRVPRASRATERTVLAAEACATLASFLGRPYASWRAYPTWELEEAWRELLQAQHHDNHECEGLCGSIGRRSMERARGLAGDVLERTLAHVARGVAAPRPGALVFNELGWRRDVPVGAGVVRDVPAFGYRFHVPAELPALERTSLTRAGDAFVLSRAGIEARVDARGGVLVGLRGVGGELLAAGAPSADLGMLCGGRRESFAAVTVEARAGEGVLAVTRRGAGESLIEVGFGLDPLHPALAVSFTVRALERPDGGCGAALATDVTPAFAELRLRHDHPYGVSEVRAERDHLRKYPTGDWMTSPQVFETVRRPFTAASFVDLLDGAAGDGRGLLLVHDGAQGFQRTADGVRQVLCAYDPWDEEYFEPRGAALLWLVPHGPASDAWRVRIARELELHRQPPLLASAAGAGRGLPPAFGALHVSGTGVLATALYREGARDLGLVERAFESGDDEPLVLRLVEFEGAPASAVIEVAGDVARAACTDLLGRVLQDLAVERVEHGAGEPARSRIEVRLRAHGIATVRLDAELARHVPRGLDAHRHVWATVHRRAEASGAGTLRP